MVEGGQEELEMGRGERGTPGQKHGIYGFLFFLSVNHRNRLHHQLECSFTSSEETGI